MFAPYTYCEAMIHNGKTFDRCEGLATHTVVGNAAYHFYCDRHYVAEPKRRNRKSKKVAA